MYRFQNSTGAYELDLSLVDQFDLAWREMHVQSDVFCSGSVILPDKAARILNVGGWSDQSTQGVRLYAPDGSAGVNGTNDWEENFQELHLQKQRWYPSTSIFTALRGLVGALSAYAPDWFDHRLTLAVCRRAANGIASEVRLTSSHDRTLSVHLRRQGL